MGRFQIQKKSGNGSYRLPGITDESDENLPDNCADSYSSFEDSDCSFHVPDPGFFQTNEISSDENDIVDWNPPIQEKPYLKCPYLDDEAVEEANVLQRKRSKFS